MNEFDQYDAEIEVLQTDVMRFLAIIAFSLLIIFIPLIQVISQQQPVKGDENVQVKQAGKQAEKPLGKDEKKHSVSSKEKKERLLVFEEGGFEDLLAEKKIKGYTIVTGKNLVFEFQRMNNTYVFNKVDALDAGLLLALRESTLPNTLIPTFRRIYPALATQKKEFYFVPSRKIKAGIDRVMHSSQYGRFKIMKNEELVHEK